MPYSIYINDHSGSVRKIGREGLASGFQSIFGPDLKEVRFFSPTQMKTALKNFDGNSCLLIGGGDGTFVTAASILRGKDIPFGLLPMGTMNLFAHDMGLPGDPLDVARLYRQQGTRKACVDMGRVNNHIFLCNAVIGVTSDLALQREQRRKEKGFIKWLALAKEIITRLAGDRYYPLTICCNGEEEVKLIKAAIISNNLYEGGQGVANRFRKKSLTDGTLGIYIVTPEGTLQSLNLLASMALGSWQHDSSIEMRESCAVELVTMRSYVNVMLDGELHRISSPLYFRSDPHSLFLLVPAGEAEAAS